MDDPRLVYVVVLLAMMMFFFVMAAAFLLLLVRPWLRSFMHGAPVTIIQILGMRLRGNPTTLILDAYIALKRAGRPETIGMVESAYIDARNRVLTSDDLIEQVKQRADMA